MRLTLKALVVLSCAWKARHLGVFGVWPRVYEVGSTGNPSRGRGSRARCGVLYHVSQMTAYFHGDELASRELLLPLSVDWTYASLDDMPQRGPVVAPPPVAACAAAGVGESMPDRLSPASGEEAATSDLTRAAASIANNPAVRQAPMPV